MMSLLTIIIIGILFLVLIAVWANRNDRTLNTDEIQQISPEEFAKKFSQLKFEGGTLKIWGKWFGKPMDNLHQIQTVIFDKNLNQLKITFDEKELLKIDKPSNIIIKKKTISIKEAERILWKWYLYGEEQIDENLKFDLFVNNGTSIIFETNFSPDKRTTNTKITEPALEICSW